MARARTRTAVTATRFNLFLLICTLVDLADSLSTKVNHVNQQLRISFVTGNEMKVGIPLEYIATLELQSFF